MKSIKFSLIMVLLCIYSIYMRISFAGTIDRQALVTRHIPVLTQADTLSPFSVGNGEFAFTVDITGLQTFSEFYENGMPLGTLAHWGWHSLPNPNGYTLADASRLYDTYGRQVPYASGQHANAGQWLRANPHRLHLGKIGFRIRQTDGTVPGISDCTDILQKADIWEGVIYSSFKVDGMPVSVETACDPDADQIAAIVHSDLLKDGRLAVQFDFPYGSTAWGKTACDWHSPDKHTSQIISKDTDRIIIRRVLDSDTYFVSIRWNGKADFNQTKKHSFILNNTGDSDFHLTVRFSKSHPSFPPEEAETVFTASKRHWQNFWETGGALDLSGSTHPGANELERRVVLSQYLTAIQCAGSTPPQETGLTCNSWYGKFHLEMHWWHAVHFPLWERAGLLEKSMDWYISVMGAAKNKAKRQGYKGIRWPKMIAPDAREGPSTVGVFLIWQQPHPIYYAELLYRQSPDKIILQKYRDLIFATADFMASYAHWDSLSNRYVLGPPLIPAQELHKATETMNPTFELAYWRYGLETAQAWRERLGMDRHEKWDHVINHLSALPMDDGIYKNAEHAPNPFLTASERRDHPTLLAAYGMLGDDSVDKKIMEKTLEKVLQTWNWESTWGWDYPLIAMTAARVGRPDLAVEALLMDVPKNTCLTNGHNYQAPRLPLYLPGNGGLLTAVAMMAAGWDNGPDIDAPGFPKDGKWQVRWENLHRLP